MAKRLFEADYFRQLKCVNNLLFVNPYVSTVLGALNLKLLNLLCSDDIKDTHYIELQDGTYVALRYYTKSLDCSSKEGFDIKNKRVPLVLVNHTLSACWKEELYTKSFLVEHGYDVLLYTRRGHDSNLPNYGGIFHPNGLKEDLRDVVLWIQRQAQYADRSLYLLGFSAGAINNQYLTFYYPELRISGMINVCAVYNSSKLPHLNKHLSRILGKGVLDLISRNQYYYKKSICRKYLSTKSGQGKEQAYHQSTGSNTGNRCALNVIEKLFSSTDLNEVYHNSIDISSAHVKSFADMKLDIEIYDQPEEVFRQKQRLECGYEVFCIGTLDDPIFDQELKMRQMEKYKIFTRYSWIHFKHGGHLGLSGLPGFGQPLWYDTILHLLNHMEFDKQTQKLKRQKTEG